MGVSLKPSAQSKFAGLDGPHIITEVRFTEFDYKTKEGESMGSSVGMMLKARTESGDEREQFYSVGPTDRWRASDDGRELDSTTGDNSRGPSENCTFSHFIVELDNAGFNAEDDVSDDISIIEDTIVDFVAKALPKVSGGERTIPVPGKVLALPDEDNDWRKKFKDASGSKGSRRSARKSAGGARRKRKSSSAGSNGIEESALKYMKQIAKDYVEVGRDDIVDMINKKARRDKQKDDILELIADEDFLTAHDDIWGYEDETITFVED